MLDSYTHPKRLPRVNRDNLDEKGKEIFDTIDQTRGGVWGPYTALMHVPELADRVASVGEYLRFHGRLPGFEREFAILLTAKLNQSRFEWVVHEPVARKEGLQEEYLEYVRSGKESELTPRLKLIVSLINSLSQEKVLSQKIYAELENNFSRDEIIELVSIAGFYQMLALVIAAFDVPEPESQFPSF